MSRTALLSKIGLGVGAALALASPALAQTELFPGESAFRPGFAPNPGDLLYTIGLPGYINAGNLRDDLTTDIIGGLTGTIRSRVYNNDMGGLTFTYLVTGGMDLDSPIVRATLGGAWSDLSVSDIGSDTSGDSGTGDPMPEWTDGAPINIERSIDGVGFQFRIGDLGTVIGADDISAVIFYETDATDWARAGAAFIDTAVEGTGGILAPARGGIIPLPSAGLLGLVGLGFVANRRRYA